MNLGANPAMNLTANLTATRIPADLRASPALGRTFHQCDPLGVTTDPSTRTSSTPERHHQSTNTPAAWRRSTRKKSHTMKTMDNHTIAASGTGSAATVVAPRRRRTDEGFTLVEILIAIVLVGILSAVVVVGVGNLTSKGTASACAASADAARSGSVVFYGSNNNAWPATLLAMTSTTPPALSLPTGVTLNTSVVGGNAIGTVATGSGWTLTMTPSVGGAQPTFVCA